MSSRLICVMLTLVSLVFATEAYGEKSIYGLTLGKSTTSQVKAGMKAKGMPLEVYPESGDMYYETKREVSFAGMTWDSVTFGFHNGILMDVTFLIYDEDQNYRRYDILDRKFYPVYTKATAGDDNITIDIETEKKTSYLTDDTVITIFIDEIGNIGLRYTDRATNAKSIVSAQDEL